MVSSRLFHLSAMLWYNISDHKQEVSVISVLSRFYEIIIRMYFQQAEHNPLHIHALYGEDMAAIDIQTGEVLEGHLLRKAIAYGKLVNGVDACKYGKQWVISMEAMKREYGEPRASL